MIKKDITFIYSDSAEKSMYEPIAEEAEKRGYSVRFTEDKFTKCEIGFYCDHVNFPQYSKFSVIMLHDIVQQHWDWPDIWIKEPWNKYDVGILPNAQWEANWKQSSSSYYARPRIGVFKAGWPKADNYCNIKKEDHRRKVVLYAPSWENDGKQAEFLEAMSVLDVDVLIKHFNAKPGDHANQFEEIRNADNQARGLPNVTVLDPATNIFEAIAKADVLVSEESSTMCEAVMMGVPAVAVSDWLVPDVTPSRMPDCDYDFVIKTPKSELKNCINDIVMNYCFYREKAAKDSENTFSNAGKASKTIMDIIDDCIADKEISYEAVEPRTAKLPNIRTVADQKSKALVNEFHYNYLQRTGAGKAVIALFRNAKNAIVNNKTEKNNA